jgi:hypothetical protein
MDDYVAPGTWIMIIDALLLWALSVVLEKKDVSRFCEVRVFFSLRGVADSE